MKRKGSSGNNEDRSNGSGRVKGSLAPFESGGTISGTALRTRMKRVSSRDLGAL